MLNKNSNSLIVGLIVFALLGGIGFFLLKARTPVPAAPETAPAAAEQQTAPVPVATETPAQTAPTQPPAAETPAAQMPADVAAMMQDRILGNADAPVTIIEYASMTCPHCAHFATQVLPEVKKRLIDTGKAKLIFRDFPLDNAALKAAMMTRCVEPDKYFNIVEVVFSNQERWSHSDDPVASLAQLGSLAGLDAEAFKTCTQNTALETALLNGVQKAQDKYRLSSTPSFIFNEGAEQFTGAQDADKFEATVNKLMQGK